MNDIITLDILAARIADKTGITQEQASQYISLIRDIAMRQLAGQSHSVTVPCVGTFTVDDVDNATVTFTPDTAIAEAVNEPFSFFEPVQLCDEVVLDTPLPEPSDPDQRTDESPVPETLDETPEIITPVADQQVEAVHEVGSIKSQEPEYATSETEAAVQNSEFPETEIVDQEPQITETEDSDPTEPVVPIRTVYIPDNATEPDPEDSIDTKPQTKTDNNNDATQQPLNEQLYDNMEYDEQQPRGMNPIVAYILGILTGMVLTCIAVFFLYPPLHSDDDDAYSPFDIEDEQATNDDITQILTENTQSETEVEAQPATTQSQPEPAKEATQTPAATTATAASAPNTQANTQNTTKPTPKASTTATPKTDTVGRNYYLATMSRKYYGRMEFWVYIYKENQSKLGHPDRIPVGTVVKIPSASKYDIDPNSQASIDKARRLAAEIKSKYSK